MPNFTVNDWCWRLGDGRVWGTRQAAFVDADAADAWLTASGLDQVPPSPVDETGEASEAGLRAALAFYGLGLGELMTPEEKLTALQGAFTGAIQARLDAFARTKNYDGILSAASYATSTVPQFAAEGQYAVEARDATWAKGYEILGAVLAGTRPEPTLAEVFAELPELDWPEAAA